MNYEQKYKEALERAKSFSEKFGGNDYAEYIFPELAESEDERIRKAIIKSINNLNKDWLGLSGTTKESMLAWLEKQKENQDSFTSLEEAANEYAGVNYDCETETDAFYHHMQKVMKEAVEGTVHYAGSGDHYIKTNQDQLNKRLKQFEEGENVKIIIVKNK